MDVALRIVGIEGKLIILGVLPVFSESLKTMNAALKVSF